MGANVLHVITRLDMGGAATNTLISVERTKDLGYESALAYGKTVQPEDQLEQRLENLRVPIFYLPHLVRNVSLWHDVQALFQLVRIIRRGQYDLIHTHSSKGGALGRFAAFLCGVPVVHTPHGHIFYGYFNRVKTAVFVRMERWLARHTQKIISLTKLETKDSLFLKIGREDQYVTIPSGVSIKQFQDVSPDDGLAFRKQHRISDDTILFVSTGRLTEVKGYDLLIKAFELVRDRLPNVRLLIAGDGEERASLEEQVKKTWLQELISFMGYIDDLRPLYSAADVFVLASRNEGMGRSFIEAMSMGLPVIGTDVGGVSCFLKDSINGSMVPKEDVYALGEALVELARSKSIREQLGSRAARDVYPDYDIETMIEKIVETYEAVLGEGT